MKKIQSVLYTIIIICFCSCEKEIDVKLPKVEKKLVLVCAISPQDTVIKVEVSLSQPIFNVTTNNQQVIITDATVIISSNAGSWTLSYDPAYRKYVIDSTQLKIRAGVTYNLSVSTPDGKFVRAITGVPYQNATLACTTSPNSTANDNITIHARWQDPAASTDYYKFEIENKKANNYWPFRSNFLKDEENPGGILKRDWSFQYDVSTNDTINASLYTISSELYNYYDRLEKVNNSNDPFSEPVPMYTNVEGGFGVFGGFNQYKIGVLP